MTLRPVPVTTHPNKHPFSTRIGPGSMSQVLQSGAVPSVSLTHMAKLEVGAQSTRPPHLPRTLTLAASSGSPVEGTHSLLSFDSLRATPRTQESAVLKIGVLLQKRGQSRIS